MEKGRTEHRCGPSRVPGGLLVRGVLPGVLGLLALLLGVGLGLVHHAFGLHALVVGGVAVGLLRLALGFLGSVLHLVANTHGPNLLGWWWHSDYLHPDPRVPRPQPRSASGPPVLREAFKGLIRLPCGSLASDPAGVRPRARPGEQRADLPIGARRRAAGKL